MRHFVIRARRGKVDADQISAEVGSKAHFEIIAHILANAFYYSNGMRSDVEVYVVLDSSPDFPRTLKFSANNGLSFPGFHEQAILEVVSAALKTGKTVDKDTEMTVAPGIQIFGFGFEVLMKQLAEQFPIYLLDKKGEDIRVANCDQDGVFVLSDHIPFSKNIIKALTNKGATKVSLGRKMLFASQCIVLIHNELDRQNG